MQKAVSSVLEAGVKRGFLNPDYMRPAWRAELDQVHSAGNNSCYYVRLLISCRRAALPQHLNSTFPACHAELGWVHLPCTSENDLR